jgi:hypothetical protein
VRSQSTKSSARPMAVSSHRGIIWRCSILPDEKRGIQLVATDTMPTSRWLPLQFIAPQPFRSCPVRRIDDSCGDACSEDRLPGLRGDPAHWCRTNADGCEGADAMRHHQVGPRCKTAAGSTDEHENRGTTNLTNYFYHQFQTVHQGSCWRFKKATILGWLTVENSIRPPGKLPLSFHQTTAPSAQTRMSTRIEPQIACRRETQLACRALRGGSYIWCFNSSVSGFGVRGEGKCFEFCVSDFGASG